MYSIRNVVKEYNTNKVLTHALNGVSFDLPDKGFIFIVGKSGSGKSTLLNILAGLDKPTTGEVIYKDNDLSKFTRDELDSYRNTEIGFVFQNSLLIDKYKVKDNLQMVLDFKREVDDGRIKEITDHLEIGDFLNSYPTQVSAGQLQRISIARALVKNPKVLFADEPTGNLDSKTSTIIMDTFEELSKDRLVVVVSHNLDDARKYGDRVIEIADGIIISDKTKVRNDENEFSVEDNIIYVPHNRPLTVSETFEINETLDKYKENAFFTRKPSNYDDSIYKQEESHYESKKINLKFKDILKYAIKDIPIFNTIMSIFIIAIIFVVLSVSEGFSAFNSDKVVKNAALSSSFNLMGGDETNIFSVYKASGYTKKYEIFRRNIQYLEEDEVNELRNIDIDNSFIQYSYSDIPWTFFQDDIMFGNVFAEDNYKHYRNAINGIVQCDIELLKNLFGDENGNITVLAGDLNTKGGIIVTDWGADLMILGDAATDRVLYPSDYEKLIESTNQNSVHYVSCVIKSGHRDDPRYQEVRKHYDWIGDKDHEQWELDHYDVINNYINLIATMYTLDPNWKENSIEYRASRDIPTRRFPVGSIHVINPTSLSSGNPNIYSSDKYYVRLTRTAYKSNECELPYHIFETIYPDLVETLSLKPSEAKDVSSLNLYTQLVFSDAKGKPISQGLYKIVKVTNQKDVVAIGRIEEDGIDHTIDKDSLFYKCWDAALKPTGVFYRNTDKIDEIIDYINSKQPNSDPFENEYFYIHDILACTALRGSWVMNLFKDIFLYADILLIIILVVILVFTTYTRVKKRKKEIGIMRSMGARSPNLSLIYFIQTAIISIISIVVGILAYLIALKGINILVSAILTKFNNMVLFKRINMIVFSLPVLFINIGIIVSTSLITSLVPLFVIRRINPIDILRSKED